MRHISRGTCALCHRELSKSAMTRHLEHCLQKVGPGQRAGERPQLQKTRSLYLMVEGRFLPMYWLHLEITAGTPLARLDRFLRDIWLECCGHLSAFEIGGVRYAVNAESDDDWGWGRRKQRMQVSLDTVLRPGQIGSYEYDFGSTTELRLKVIAEREATTPEQAIHILARNNLLRISCERCGKPATIICPQCIYEENGNLCERCAKDHECGEELLLPVTNSPRAGVCGYTGQNASYFSQPH